MQVNIKRQKGSGKKKKNNMECNTSHPNIKYERLLTGVHV